MSTLKVLLLVANWLHVGRDDEREYVSTPYSLPPLPRLEKFVVKYKRSLI